MASFTVLSLGGLGSNVLDVQGSREVLGVLADALDLDDLLGVFAVDEVGGLVTVVGLLRDDTSIDVDLLPLLVVLTFTVIVTSVGEFGTEGNVDLGIGGLVLVASRTGFIVASVSPAVLSATQKVVSVQQHLGLLLSLLVLEHEGDGVEGGEEEGDQ